MPRYDRDGNMVFYTKRNPIADLSAIAFARELARIKAGPGSPDEPDLSGQWADEMSGPALVSAALFEAGYRPDDPDATDRLFTDICDAYEDEYYLAKGESS